MTRDWSPTTKASLETLGVLTTVTAFVDFLPAIAALLGVVWWLIQIWDRFAGRDGKRRERKSDPSNKPRG